jgi:hypothetical protein
MLIGRDECDYAHEHLDPGIRLGDSPVMLSAAKHLAAPRDRPFASLRVTLEVPMYRPLPKIQIILFISKIETLHTRSTCLHHR